MAHTTVAYRVQLNTCLQHDVLAICNVLRTILANEQGAHSVSRPPIFSSGVMQMAQELLQNVYDNYTSRETVHVLAGSHNMYFKLRFESEDDAGGTCYHIDFCYRDKRPASFSEYATTKTKSSHKRSYGDGGIDTQTTAGAAKRNKQPSCDWENTQI